MDGRYEPTFLDGLQLIATLGIFFLVFYYAVIFRDEANKEIAKIQDIDGGAVHEPTRLTGVETPGS